jgi:hypothetical protein
VEAFLEDFHQIDSLIFEATGINPTSSFFPAAASTAITAKSIRTSWRK